jgi:hypothetical protein
LRVKQKLKLTGKLEFLFHEDATLRHLDLTDILQYQTPPSPPNQTVNRGYTVFHMGLAARYIYRRKYVLEGLK